MNRLYFHVRLNLIVIYRQPYVLNHFLYNKPIMKKQATKP